MNNKKKWIKWYIIGCSATIFLIILISLANSLAHSVRSTTENVVTFVTPKSNQIANEAVEYVQDTYDLDVVVTANKVERSQDREQRAIHVHTNEPRDIDFIVYTSPSGEIKGDTYARVKKRYQLNNHFNDSTIYEELTALGFKQMSFNDQADDPSFSITLQEELFIEEDFFDVLYEAYPLLQHLQEQAKKLDYTIDSIHLVDGFDFSIDEDFASFDDFKKSLIAEHTEFIHRMQERAVKDKIKAIEEEIDEYDLYMSNVYCTEQEDDELCETYQVILQARHQEGHSEEEDPLRYDNQEDIERIYQAVKLIASVDEAISKVAIQTMFVPEERDLLSTSEQQLEEENRSATFISSPILIKNIGAIRSVDDIILHY